MTYAFDEWMKREHPRNPFSRYADDAVAHCRSEAEAKRLLAAIDERLKECKLEMHPEKSGIVYCKDSARRKEYPRISFTFLGYEFRPRRTKRRNGKSWMSFLPAISASAKKRIVQAIREWNLPRQTSVSLNELARRYNQPHQRLDELLRHGLTGRTALKQMTAAYESHRRDGVLPASYEVVYGQAWGNEHSPRGLNGEVRIPTNKIGRRR